MTLTRPPGRIEMLNGQQLYFEVHGTGEPLLLLHGFSGSSQDWIPSLEQWGTGFQLILPDLRGHGHSGILSKPFRHEEAARDMFALLESRRNSRLQGRRHQRWWQCPAPHGHQAT